MNVLIAIALGFEPIPHFTIGDVHTYNLGRDRQLSFSNIGTANEFLHITQLDKHNLKVITDIICIHNYDYDGLMTTTKLENIINALSSKII
tara:strand:+ start:1206 stop:1478 length:273 start_codon:yes stop_codon:yes gene_type:complete